MAICTGRVLRYREFAPITMGASGAALPSGRHGASAAYSTARPTSTEFGRGRLLVTDGRPDSRRGAIVGRQFTCSTGGILPRGGRGVPQGAAGDAQRSSRMTTARGHPAPQLAALPQHVAGAGREALPRPWRAGRERRRGCACRSGRRRNLVAPRSSPPTVGGGGCAGEWSRRVRPRGGGAEVVSARQEPWPFTSRYGHWRYAEVPALPADGPGAGGAAGQAASADFSLEDSADRADHRAEVPAVHSGPCRGGVRRAAPLTPPGGAG